MNNIPTPSNEYIYIDSTKFTNDSAYRLLAKDMKIIFDSLDKCMGTPVSSWSSEKMNVETEYKVYHVEAIRTYRYHVGIGTTHLGMRELIEVQDEYSFEVTCVYDTIDGIDHPELVEQLNHYAKTYINN